LHEVYMLQFITFFNQQVYNYVQFFWLWDSCLRISFTCIVHVNNTHNMHTLIFMCCVYYHMNINTHTKYETCNSIIIWRKKKCPQSMDELDFSIKCYELHMVMHQNDMKIIHTLNKFRMMFHTQIDINMFRNTSKWFQNTTFIFHQ
jgi:hypothetical protein